MDGKFTFTKKTVWAVALISGVTLLAFNIFFKVGIAHSKFKGNFLRGLVKRRIEDIQKSPAVFGSAGRNFFIKEAQARNLKNIQIFFCSQDFSPTPKREKKIGTRPKKSACRAGSPTL